MTLDSFAINCDLVENVFICRFVDLIICRFEYGIIWRGNADESDCFSLQRYWRLKSSKIWPNSLLQSKRFFPFTDLLKLSITIFLYLTKLFNMVFYRNQSFHNQVLLSTHGVLHPPLNWLYQKSKFNSVQKRNSVKAFEKYRTEIIGNLLLSFDIFCWIFRK